jgi:hypothetical protein
MLWNSAEWWVTAAMYWRTSLPASVLPDPLSPVSITAWSSPATAANLITAGAEVLTTILKI